MSKVITITDRRPRESFDCTGYQASTTAARLSGLVPGTIPTPHGSIPNARRRSSVPQNVELVIYSDVIFQRIEDDTQFLAQMSAAVNGGDTNDTHSLSTDEKTRRHLLPYLDLSYDRILNICTAYLADKSTGYVSSGASQFSRDDGVLRADNAPTQWSQRTIRLRMPHDWPATNLQQLANTVSDYIVKSMEFEFLSLAYGADAKITLQRRDLMLEDENQIQAALNARTPAQRNLGYPYWS